MSWFRDFWVGAGLTLCCLGLISAPTRAMEEVEVEITQIAPCTNKATPSPCKDDGLGACTTATNGIACHAAGADPCSCRSTSRGCQCNTADP